MPIDRVTLKEISIQAAKEVLNGLLRDLSGEDIPDDIYLEVKDAVKTYQEDDYLIKELALEIRNIWGDNPEAEEITTIWIVSKEGDDVQIAYTGSPDGWSGASWTDYPWRASVPVPAMSQYWDEEAEEGIKITPLDKFGQQVDPYIEIIRRHIGNYKELLQGRAKEGKLPMQSDSAFETSGFWDYIEFYAPDDLKQDTQRIDKIRNMLIRKGYIIDGKEEVVIDKAHRSVLGIEFWVAEIRKFFQTQEDSGMGVGSVLEPLGPKDDKKTGEPIFLGEEDYRKLPEDADIPWGTWEEQVQFYPQNEESRYMWMYLHQELGQLLNSNKEVRDKVISRLNEMGYKIDIGSAETQPKEEVLEKAPKVVSKPGISQDEQDEILGRLSELQKQKREMGLSAEEQAEYDKLSQMLRESNKKVVGETKELKDRVIQKLRAYQLDPDEAYLITDTRTSRIAVLIIDKKRNEDVLYELYNRYVQAMRGIDYILTACKSDTPDGSIIRTEIYRKGQIDPITQLEEEIATDPDGDEIRNRIEIERTGEGYRLLIRNSDMYPTGDQVRQMYDELQARYEIPNLPFPENIGGQGGKNWVDMEEGSPGGTRSYSLEEVLRVYRTLPRREQTNILGYLARYSYAQATSDTARSSAVTGLVVESATPADAAYLQTIFPFPLWFGAQVGHIRSVGLVNWLGQGMRFGFPTSIQLRHEAQRSGEGHSLAYRANIGVVAGVVVENEEDRKPFEDGTNGILYGVGGGLAGEVATPVAPVTAKWDIKAGKNEAGILKVGQKEFKVGDKVVINPDSAEVKEAIVKHHNKSVKRIIDNNVVGIIQKVREATQKFPILVSWGNPVHEEMWVNETNILPADKVRVTPLEQFGQMSKKAETFYWYAEKREVDQEDKYTVFRVDDPEGWGEGKAKVKAKQMGMALAGGGFGEQGIPYNFAEDYTVIDTNDITEEQVEEYEQRTTTEAETAHTDALKARGVGEKLGEYDESKAYQHEIDYILEEGGIEDRDYILDRDSTLREIWETSGNDSDLFYQKVKEAGLWDSFKDLVEANVFSDTDLLNFYWEMVADNLTEIMNERTVDGDWVVKGEGMGWQSRSGTKEFNATTGTELVQKVLPEVDVTFYVYDYMDGKGLAINNYHHDAPTGEWYYLLPKKERIKIKPLEQFGQVIEKFKVGDIVVVKNIKVHFDNELTKDQMRSIFGVLPIGTSLESWYDFDKMGSQGRVLEQQGDYVAVQFDDPDKVGVVHNVVMQIENIEKKVNLITPLDKFGQTTEEDMEWADRELFKKELEYSVEKDTIPNPWVDPEFYAGTTYEWVNEAYGFTIGDKVIHLPESEEIKKHKIRKEDLGEGTGYIQNIDIHPVQFGGAAKIYVYWTTGPNAGTTRYTDHTHLQVVPREVKGREGDTGGEVLTDKNDKEDNKKDRKRDYTEKRIKPKYDKTYEGGAGWDSDKGNTDGKDDMAYNRLNIGRKIEGDYNGWANYETWNVNLWIDNEEDLYNEVKGDRDPTKKYTVEEVKQVVRRFFPTGTPDMEGGRRDLEKVDYQEITDAWNDELDEYIRYEEEKDKKRIKPLEEFGIKKQARSSIADLLLDFVNGIIRGNSGHITILGDVLYSHDTPIAVRQEGKIYLNPQRYSISTSRAQNILRQYSAEVVDAGYAEFYRRVMEQKVPIGRLHNPAPAIAPLEQFGQVEDPEEIDKKEVYEWAKNIADNYNNDRGPDIQSQLMDASEELGLDYRGIDKRWQYCSPGDEITPDDVFYLLLGEYIPEDIKIKDIGITPLEQFGQTRFSRTYKKDYNFKQVVVPLNQEE